MYHVNIHCIFDIKKIHCINTRQVYYIMRILHMHSQYAQIIQIYCK